MISNKKTSLDRSPDMPTESRHVPDYAGVGQPPPRMEVRFQSLMSRIVEESLAAVMRAEDVDAADRGLLALLLVFPNAFEGEEEARKILSERFAREFGDVPRFRVGMGEVEP